jgi:inosose dehydratase
MTKRRDFLKISGLGLAAIASPGLISAGNLRLPEAGKPTTKYSFQLGVASYSFRKFPAEKALDMTLRLGVDRISLKDFHLPLNSSKEDIAKTIALFKAKGILPYAAGVIYMKTKADADNAFEYAKAAGLKMFVGVPNYELLDYVEEKIKQYDIIVAIHNHGPGDQLYPSAESIYSKIKNRDKRLGLCIDIGHTKRIGRDPEQDLQDFFDRVYDMHIKDETSADKNGNTCEIGRGVINFPSFLKTVVKLGYTGTLALEFEKDENDPLPGMAESIGYVKGVLATI